MRAFVICLLFVLSTSAHAYIGPGAGLSVLGSLWAVLVGIVLALFAILSWPIRILWRRLRGSEEEPVVAAQGVVQRLCVAFQWPVVVPVRIGSRKVAASA